MKQNFKRTLTLLVLLTSLVWLMVLYFPDKKVRVIFCDVGQGDATLITQGFNQILIDGGPNDKVLQCLSNNVAFYDKKIEIVILTHPEADHMTGIIPVMDKYEIEYFLSGPEGNDSAVYQTLTKKIKEKINVETGHAPSLRLINPYTGDRIKLGSIELDTLWPEKSWVAEQIKEDSVIQSEAMYQTVRGEAKNPDESKTSYGILRGKASLDDNRLVSNQTTIISASTSGGAVLGLTTTNTKFNQFSLVFLLTFNSNVETGHAPSLQIKKKKVLLMGDADEVTQKKIIGLQEAVSSLSGIDILKFPHHGSKTGMSGEFLEMINPKEAVISVGKNSYGHPTKEALDMLEKAGVKIRRTDLEGEINYKF